MFLFSEEKKKPEGEAEEETAKDRIESGEEEEIQLFQMDRSNWQPTHCILVVVVLSVDQLQAVPTQSSWPILRVSNIH